MCDKKTKKAIQSISYITKEVPLVWP